MIHVLLIGQVCARHTASTKKIELEASRRGVFARFKQLNWLAALKLRPGVTKKLFTHNFRRLKQFRIQVLLIHADYCTVQTTKERGSWIGGDETFSLSEEYESVLVYDRMIDLRVLPLFLRQGHIRMMQG
ncbi:MAG: hypothetical protein CL912_27605 [Deltaproteobacteria bacterium]|nr:hypothetical protein [Deltaproteobacteria bacterium]